MNQVSGIDRRFEAFVSKYNEPGYDFNVVIARLFVGLFFVWKLLSRDWGFFGTVPESMFYFYPYELYAVGNHDYMLWTGLPVLTEVLTFHWIHFFIPHPGVEVLRIVQGIGIVLSFCFALFGSGPKNILLISLYSVLVYLWGYLFMMGQDIDAVYLYFGILIAIGISTFRDEPVWRIHKIYRHAPNVAAGRSISNVILVFIFYYFASGVKKLTDLNPLEWFHFDLIEGIEEHAIRVAHGWTGTFDIFQYLHGLYFLDYLGPPLVYSSHLLVPIVFFRRNTIVRFFIFYALFHVLSFGVGISFTGYIPVWLTIFPHRENLAWIGARLEKMRSLSAVRLR